MLAEALTWLITPAPWVARRFGYLKEAVAITARYHRCRDAWAPHLAASRSAVTAFSAALSSRRTLVVLGSGAGLDLPLEALANEWQQVVLVDLVHPWPIRHRARRWSNVALATWDVGGVLPTLRRHPPVLVEPHTDWPLPPETDAVISLNLMAQLPVLPLAWLERRGVSEAERHAWARAVVAAHWRQLATLSLPVLLLTDFAAEWWVCENHSTQNDNHNKEKMLAVASTLFGFALPCLPQRTWPWRIAPCGEESPLWERRLQVGQFVWRSEKRCDWGNESVPP